MDGFASRHEEPEHELDVMMEAPPLVRFDERRMHVRAYNYWASLLGDRSFPSIEDLNPEEIEDFGSHSVLLDFTGGMDDPVIAFLGSALSRECGVGKLDRISEVPPRTLLSRLTDHYLQIIANRAPIGFEAEFTNQRGSEILYRGILMPFSSDDDTIDFVYGVINWKEVASAALTSDIERAMSELSQTITRPVAVPAWADGPLSGSDERAATQSPRAEMDDLVGALEDARDAAADAIAAEGRSHHALYRALGLAHAFALIAEVRTDDYARLLADAGILIQPKSPMTALAKLVFGAGYDKTRLSEYAAVIEHAIACDVPAGALADEIALQPGGLKALVRAARAARRGETSPRDPLADARAQLRAAPLQDLAMMRADADGLAVMVMRRTADGQFAPVAGVAADERCAESFLRALARRT